jgi:beta-phosphoglucomutase-like phosphatase (HAD superfamily)
MSATNRPVAAWIFDWDGIFVDSEKWKAWTYGLGLSDVYPDFGRLEASHFDAQEPRSSDPFLQVCGRFVGKSREEYARGVVAYYDELDYRLSQSLTRVAGGWAEATPDRLQQIRREREKTGVPPEAPPEPWEVFFELRRPYYQRYQDNVDPISGNVHFLTSLPEDVAVGLVTRTPEDRVRALMERFAIPVGRFGTLTCVPQKEVSKAQMYERTASHLGIELGRCAAVEDTETGVVDARRAGEAHGQRMAVIIACPTPITAVQDFGAADLVVRGGLSTLAVLTDSVSHRSLLE